MPKVPKIIVALDFDTLTQAKECVKNLNPELWRLKIGITLFTQCGPQWLKSLQQQGFEIFLDLKYHDIPFQVEGACYQAAKLGVWMLNVHAGGGHKMLEAARRGVDRAKQETNTQSLLIAVTVLTSMQQDDLAEVGVRHPLPEQVLQLAQLTYQAGLDGIVCSAQEASLIKQHTAPNFLCVTPGIRLPQDSNNDQKRVLTPWDALAQGSDHLVMGRSITQAGSPNTIRDTILAQLEA